MIKGEPKIESEADDYRYALAEELKMNPKEKRGEILELAKETPEYWDARTQKLKEREGEEEVDDGLGILVKKKVLYHGSATTGIKKFNKAEETTVGEGIYLTSEAKDAIGYARGRSKFPGESGSDGAIIYESSIEDLRLVDLRKKENVIKVLDGFKQILSDKLKDPDIKWNVRGVLEKAIDTINSDMAGPGTLKLVAFGTGWAFSEYCKSLGYDGLITFEGGEEDYVGNHDTYLIFEPEKVKIIQEQKIK